MRLYSSADFGPQQKNSFSKCCCKISRYLCTLCGQFSSPSCSEIFLCGKNKYKSIIRNSKRNVNSFCSFSYKMVLITRNQKKKNTERNICCKEQQQNGNNGKTASVFPDALAARNANIWRCNKGSANSSIVWSTYRPISKFMALAEVNKFELFSLKSIR